MMQVMKALGCQSNVAPIRRMLLKHPQQAFRDQARIEGEWRGLGYAAAPVLEAALEEYQRLVELLSGFGIELLFLPESPGVGLDSIYVHDPVLVTEHGAILCRMGKPQRASEPQAVAGFLNANGLPILGAVEGEGRLEGGDVIWLDERTLAVGEGYRSNAEGIRQLRELLGDAVDEVRSVPLPHWKGPDDVLHLMSLISPLDHDLAVVHSPLLTVPFRQWLLERGLTLVEVAEAEHETLACNVLALAPRVCLMLEGNPETRRLLERVGVEVRTFSGREIALKGAGGPTCLTRPLLRE
jgi:N-dimethylarginine dimethylaminohydrolase